MSGTKSAECRCHLCTGLVDMPRALRALRADETGHDRGCECPRCKTYGPADVRDVLDCSRDPGVHQWLADLYLSVIEPGRCDLLRAPEWARELAIVGDNERSRARRKNRKKKQKQLNNSSQWQGQRRGR